MIFVKNIPLSVASFNSDAKRVENSTKEHDIAIKFYHVTKGNDKNRGRSTKCELICIPSGEVLTRNNGEILSVGETRVFSGNYYLKADRFDRRIGRKESLARALSKTDLTKEDKSRIWAKYREVCKLP